PQTFPRSLADMPASTPAQYPGIADEETYSEGLDIGYRWFDAHGIQPLFPFGYGLSYTTFAFSDLKLDGASATFTLTNTGGPAGADVAQAYVGFPAALGEPPHRLEGFQKVFLEPGESRTVTLPLDARAFSYWGSGGWTQAPGCYGVSVGDSSRSLPLSGDVA